MKLCSSRIPVLVLAFLLQLGLILPVRSAAAAELKILIDVFSASEEAGGVSPNLEYIRAQLGNTPFKFNSYRSLGTKLLTLESGIREEVVFDVSWNLLVGIEVLEANEESVSLSLTLSRDGEEFLATTVDLARTATVLVGGPALPDGVMMIAVTEGW